MIKYLLRIKYNSDEYWIGLRTLHRQRAELQYSTWIGGPSKTICRLQDRAGLDRAGQGRPGSWQNTLWKGEDW